MATARTPSRFVRALLAIVAGGTLCVGGHVPDAHAIEPPDPHASDLIRPSEKHSPDQQRRERTRRTFLQKRAAGPAPEVVYGADDRQDWYQVAEPGRRELGDAVCAITTASNVASNGDGTYRLLDVGRFTEALGSVVCEDEAFRGQLRIGFCSGFLVAPDVIATAGHCIDAPDVAIIFGFDQFGPGLGAPDEFDPARVPEAQVYFASQIMDRKFAGELDYAVVRLDREVSGREPLAIRRAGEVAASDPLLLIGHGIDLPKKFDAGGRVQDPLLAHAYFTANLDAFGGSSGAPVMNLATGVVEGILVRGKGDFVVQDGCARSRACPDAGCPGFEEITRSSVFAMSVPQIGVQVTPLHGVEAFGPVGGPFTGASTQYTLTNTAAAPADYSVSIDLGATAPLLLNGGAGAVTGSLAPGAHTAVTVTLAPGAAALPAGTYSATLRFGDLSNAVELTRVVLLDVGTTGIEVLPLGGVTLSGKVGGPFIGARGYSITSTRETPVQVLVQGDQSWIAVDGGASQSFTLSGVGAGRIVTIGASSDAGALQAGWYAGNVSFLNQSGGPGSTVRSASLEAGRLNYASSGAPVAIPDRGAMQSTIFVGDSWCIGDVNIDVDIAHGFVGDLIVEVESPGGGVVRLHNRTGADGVGLVATYDQQGAAGTVIPDGPGSLSAFNDGPAQGPWTLRITDNAGGHAGALNSWSVRIVPKDGCAPIAQSQSVRLAPTVTSPLSLFATSFSQAPVSFRVLSLPAHGQLFDPVTGVISAVPHDVEFGGVEVRYRPALGYAGPDGFVYAAVESGIESAPAAMALAIGVDREVARFDFDADPGWSMQGQWALGAPSGGGTFPGDPLAAFTGTSVVGYNLAGDYPALLAAAQYATTGPIDLRGVSLPRVEFERWLGVERSAFDRATIEVSVDGGSHWETVWMNPDVTLLDSAWLPQSVALPAAAGGAADVRLRWGMGPTDALVNYAGWNIDDVRLIGLTAPDPACAIDLNSDGILDLDDFFAFFNALDQQLPEGDVNADGRTDTEDFFWFFTLWDQGGC